MLAEACYNARIVSLRGFKRDHAATEAANFSDPRSYISLPKVIQGECTEPKPHLVLFGTDKGPIRAEIFRRNRVTYLGINRCWKCGRQVFENQEDADASGVEYTTSNAGNWHHIRHAPGTRCDCPCNGMVLCEKDHLQEHPQTQFGRHEKIKQAAVDFS